MRLGEVCSLFSDAHAQISINISVYVQQMLLFKSFQLGKNICLYNFFFYSVLHFLDDSRALTLRSAQHKHKWEVIKVEYFISCLC